MVGMHRGTVTRAWGLALLLAGAGLVLGGPGALAEAATLNVANNGVDSPTCGAAASPCRSISQAIANAGAGDTIMVGPGRYGDLDGDGNFTSPGEEAAEVGSGCLCMIKVDKAVTIISRLGAGATVLDAGGASISVVRIQTTGVIFGLAKKGFTLTGGNVGLSVEPTASGVRAGGNLAIANTGNGFVTLLGSGHFLTGNAAIANGNLAFVVDAGAGHQLSGNLASANGNAGFFLSGNGHLLSGNQAVGNVGAGFVLFDTGHQLTGNLASANTTNGFLVFGSGHVITGNGAQGNLWDGVSVNGTATINNNNLYGNDPTLNCGLRNQSGSPIDARNNFWGAATGPGADPADNVCNSGAGSSTTTAPSATKPFSIKSKPLF